MLCTHKAKTGSRCKAHALKGGGLCFTHDPNVADAREVAVRKGGLSKKPRSPGKPLKRLPARKPSDTVKILEDTINRIRTDAMTPQHAKTIAILTALSLRAMQLDDPYEP
jgi:hypothetical protein